MFLTLTRLTNPTFERDITKVVFQGELTFVLNSNTIKQIGENKLGTTTIITDTEAIPVKESVEQLGVLLNSKGVSE